MRRLLALLCRVAGHAWSDPVQVGEYAYRSWCDRCGATVGGDWDALEAAGAWKHYRSDW